MEKYNKFLQNIAELIENGLFSSKDLAKEVKDTVKFNTENIANKLNLVSREEFEVQKKRVEKLENQIIKFKKKNKKPRKVKKS